MLVAAVFISSTMSAHALEVNDKQLDQIFKGYDAAFVLREIRPDAQTWRYHPDKCAEALSPCSTFKIFNSLVALDSGVIADENATFKWDGTHHDRPELNQDQTLKSAISRSAVWCFQLLAKKIGSERMSEYLQLMHYGNENMSSGLTQFWLGKGNSLRISADEQVNFMERLVKSDLPVSERACTTVKKIMRLKETETGTLYGKTGTDSNRGKHTLGWFVGYVQKSDKVFAFATNIRGAEGANGRKARALTEEILANLNLM